MHNTHGTQQDTSKIDHVNEYFTNLRSIYPEIDFRDVAEKLVESESWPKISIYQDKSTLEVGNICKIHTLYRGSLFAEVTDKISDEVFRVSYHSESPDFEASSSFQSSLTIIDTVTHEEILVDTIFNRIRLFAISQGEHLDEFAFGIHFQCDGVKKAIIASMKNNTNLDFFEATK